MIRMNGRFPAPPLSTGTASPIQPRTPVIPIMPMISRIRPRAERISTRIPSAPIA